MESSQKNLLIIGGVIVVLAIVGWLIYYTVQSGQLSPVSKLDNNNLNNSEIIENNENETAVKTFTIDAQNFSFAPAEIRVKTGDRVKIILNNIEGFHDWVVDEFNAKTEKAQGPSTKEVEFVADKTGTFEFYCSVGEHRQMGMKGNLIVE